MSNVETVIVPHLGNSTIGYKFARPYDASLPTLVLVNSFTTSAELYRPQFADAELTATANLLAIELYGHGRTRTDFPHFTYWDTALANLQVLEALGIAEAFVLGTSQGGWVTARMAMLQPDMIAGIVPLGTSMDDESQRSRDLGCWDGAAICAPVIDDLSEPVDDDWVVADDFVDFVLGAGLGPDVSDTERDFWIGEYRKNYSGDAGRRRLRMCSINLSDRDGLHGRLDGVQCPVLWMQGTADQVYSVANAQDEIKMFTSSPSAELQVVDGGQHFLSASDPAAVNGAVIEFINKTT
jgi:pimeloyl-ACP methyl ester carboxylesterase